MFKKILFPTDFSQGAYAAIKSFEKSNQMEVGELILLNVVEESVLEEMMEYYTFYYDRYKSEKSELKDIEARLKEERVKRLNEKAQFVKDILKPKSIKLLIRFGLPYKEIIDVADEEDVSMILLPSHGKLDFIHEFLGSTTHRVLHKTKKPVLLIKTIDVKDD